MLSSTSLFILLRKLFRRQTSTQGDHIAINLLDPTGFRSDSWRSGTGGEGGRAATVVVPEVEGDGLRSPGGRKRWGRRSEVEGWIGRRDQIRQRTAASHQIGQGGAHLVGSVPSCRLPEVSADLLPAGGANERSAQDPSARLHPSSPPVAAPEERKGRGEKINSAVIQTDGVYFSSQFPFCLHTINCSCWRAAAPCGSGWLVRIPEIGQFHQNTKLLHKCLIFRAVWFTH